MGFQLHSLEENGEETDKLDFLTRHGRVLVEIALAGMFERNAGRAGLLQDDSRAGDTGLRAVSDGGGNECEGISTV